MLPEQTVLLVILVAAALVMSGGAIAFVKYFKESGDIEACRLAVLAHSKLKTFGTSPLSADCPRRDVGFFTNKVEINGKKSKDYTFSKLSEDAVNRVVADEMASCWYKMGEGNVDVFDQDFVYDIKKVCLICAEVRFDSDMADNSFANLDNFMKKNTPLGSGTTYSNYLTQGQRDKYITLGYGAGSIPYSQYFGGWRDGSTNLVQEDQKFSTKESYVIYFLASKPDWFSEKVAAFTPAYYIGVGKPSKLSRECNLLVN